MQPYLDLDKPQGIARLREMIEQRRDHLFEAHRNGAATDADRQYLFFQVRNAASICVLRRKDARKRVLQALKPFGMFLEAGNRHVTPQIAM